MENPFRQLVEFRCFEVRELQSMKSLILKVRIPEILVTAFRWLYKGVAVLVHQKRRSNQLTARTRQSAISSWRSLLDVRFARQQRQPPP